MEQLLEYIRKFGQLDLREENLIRQAFEKKSIPKSMLLFTLPQATK